MERSRGASARGVEKVPTGIAGFDEVTGGGVPRGRTTLVCGGPGCGKSLFAMEFLARGAGRFGEPGLFVSFEESPADLLANFAHLDFDLAALIERRRLAIDAVVLDASEIEETGEYDLEGLFVRLAHAIDSISAKRVVLDTIETLFSGLQDHRVLRSELARLFRWLKDRGMTAVVTAERGPHGLTRFGLEEYISDCVVFLDHRADEQVSTRRLRIVKYRGSPHGTNEYPFAITTTGLQVLPITTLDLDHVTHTERVSTGVPALDALLEGGPHRGSSVLLSGGPGTGKTSLASHLALAASARGERSLFFTFEESPAQLRRNMKSIGLDLETPERDGLLRIHAVRPQFHGLETHLIEIERLLRELAPALVIVDPLSALINAGSAVQARAMAVRLVHALKAAGTTAVLTSLGARSSDVEGDFEVFSLMDTWIVLRDPEVGGARRNTLLVLKSRGTAHSRRVHPFRIGRSGIELATLEAPRAHGGPDE
jgi:circadian clock protein KaiC